MKQQDLDDARMELSIKAKNGIDFITSASIIWVIITFIWTLSYAAYTKSVFTLMASGLMLPLAIIFSKVYKAQWKIQDNALQPLGLILNIAQLFYFPFLILCLIKFPNYFILAYAVITGAHFFPYSWFYNKKAFGFFGGLISLGTLVIGLIAQPENMFYIPLYTSVCLVVLGIALQSSSRRDYK